MRERQGSGLFVVVIATIVFALFIISVNFPSRLHTIFQAYARVSIPQFAPDLIFLLLTVLLWVTYRRWRAATKRQARLEDIIDSISPDALLVVDADRTIIMCNNSLKRVFGYEVDEVVSQKTELLYFDRRSNPGHQREIYEVLERDGFHVGWATGKKKDGTVIPLEIITGNLSGHAGAVLLVRDITERKRAEEALSAEKQRLAVTLSSIGDGVIATDTEGKIALINKAAEGLTGWTQAEAVGKPLCDILHLINERTRARCQDPVEQVLENGAAIRLGGSILLVAREGTERSIAVDGAPIRDRDDNAVGVVLVFKDITQQRKMEEEFLKARKLESVGLLAGGIAHDFNNLLTGIIGNISLAKVLAKPGDKVSKILAEAEKASARAKDLTQQLLTFSKGGAPLKKTASISELIKDSTGFALSGSNVKCEFWIASNLYPVEVDQGQMSQVVNNLILNAVQAMPQGGTIQVRVENVTLAASDAVPLPHGKYLRISVKDQGVGITQEDLDKIFDPYFTTKKEGNGLGLSTAYSIVKRHGGHITVESGVGKGTTFYIYLPASTKEITTKEDAGGTLLVGKGKILVMDDEDIISDVAGRMLGHMGYEVVTAKDGSEAIELCIKARESGHPFDVVLMDLTVPGGVGGKQAIRRLREIDPEIKAIVSSGYSSDRIMSDFERYGFNGVIEKPYSVEELSETLRQVMKRTRE